VWIIATVLLGTFSIYALVATAVAGVILVLHPRRDVRVRLVAVAVQSIVQVGYLAVISGTYSGDALHAFWKTSDGYVELDANPFTTAGNFVDHLRGVFSVYPTDAHRLALVAAVVALAGLAYAARRTRAVPARFLLLLFAVAAAGGVLQVLPFGAWHGFSYWGRLTLWLVPSIALGLAEALRQCAKRLGHRSIARATFDIALYAFAVVVFVASIGKAPPYTVSGSHTATAYIDAHRRSDDLLVLVPRSAYAYGIETRAPVDFRPDAQSIVGSRLVFDDHTVQFEYRPAPDIRDRLTGVRTVYVYAAVPRRGILQRAQPVIDQLRATGFHERERLHFDQSKLQIWTRGP
jgi:hypothetical protein